MSTIRLWFYKHLTWWLPESRAFAYKAALLRWAGAKIGQNVRIYSSVTFLGNGHLEIGDDVHIGAKVLIYPTSSAKITIGSHVDIAPEVTILTGGHEIDVVGYHIGGKGTALSVFVGDGSWLCARSLILPGVELPSKTVVAAGSVVTKTITRPKNLLAGIPAQVKKVY